MTTIATLGVSLTARTQGFERGMQRARKQLGTFSTGVAKAARSTAAIGAAVTTALAGVGLTAMVRQQFALVDSTSKVSDKLGIATERLIGLRHAAEVFSGATTQTFDIALQRMVRRVSEAAAGTGEARDAIRELGLDATALAALTPDQQFERIADAMAGVSDQGRRVRLTMKLVDSEGVKLVSTFQQGSKELQRMQQQAERFGLTFGRTAGAQIEAANDALSLMRGAFGGIARRVAIEIAPYVGAIAQWLAESFESARGIDGTLGAAFAKGIKFVGVVRDAISLLATPIHALAGILDASMAGVLMAIRDAMGGLIRQLDTLVAKFPLIAKFLGAKGGLAVSLDKTIEKLSNSSKKNFADAARSMERFLTGAAQKEADAFLQGIKDNAAEIRANLDARASLRELLAQHRAGLGGGGGAGLLGSGGVIDMNRVSLSTPTQTEAGAVRKREQDKLAVLERIESNTAQSAKRQPLAVAG